MFLPQLRDDPDDRLLWSALADWFDDHGDPRAEWVRLSLLVDDLHPLDAEFGSATGDLRQLQSRALDAIEAEWAPRPRNVAFRHLFRVPKLTATQLPAALDLLEDEHTLGVDVTPDVVLAPDDLKAVLERLPSVRWLACGDALADPDQLHTRPELASLVHLETGLSGLPDWNSTPDALAGLRHLNLTRVYRGSALAEPEGSIPPEWASRLHTLTLPTGGVIRFVKAFREASEPLQLRRLNFKSLIHYDQYLEPVSQWLRHANAPHLTHLDFDPTAGGRATSFMDALCAGPLSRQLKTLFLARISASSVTKLARKTFPELTRAALSLPKLSPKAVRELISADWFSRLETLFLEGTETFYAGTWPDLANSGHDFSHLTSLNFGQLKLPTEIVSAFAEPGRFANLKRLSILMRPSASLPQLLRMPLPSLTDLEVSTAVTDFQALDRTTLVGLPLWQQLTSLTLRIPVETWADVPRFFTESPSRLQHLTLIATGYEPKRRDPGGFWKGVLDNFAAAFDDSPLSESVQSLRLHTLPTGLPYDELDVPDALRPLLRAGGQFLLD